MRRLTIFAAWSLLFIFATSKMVEWTTDYWWFSSLGQADTFIRLMAWRTGGFVVGATLFALVFGQNVRLALTYLYAHTMEFLLLGSGINRFGGPSFEVLRRATTVFSCVATFMAGLAVANRFELWVALFGAIKTGQIDRASGHDIGFFLFTLPALTWLWNFFGVALFLSLLCCACLYFWGELIEAGPQILKVSHRVASHLIFLCASLILWQGVRQGIHIVSAPIAVGWGRSDVFGPAEMFYETPTRLFFLLTSIPLAFLITRNSLDERRFTSNQNTVGVTACLWVGLSMVLPALSAPLGRSRIANDDKNQRSAISRHLTSTREAWELDNTNSTTIKSPQGGWVNTTRSVLPNPTSTDAPFAAEGLWPLEPLRQWANKQSDGAVSRVHIIRQKSGAIYRAVGSNTVSYKAEDATILDLASANGAPKTISREVIPHVLLTENPPETSRDSTRYVSPTPEDPIVLPARYRENKNSEFAVERRPFFQSFLLALRFTDRSLLAPGDGITWNLDPIQRARALFPFINFTESDAQPELIDGKLIWNIAGFSISRNYPDSAALQTDSSWRGINYLRQSSAVMLDATTGEAFIRQLALDEPFSELWAKAFPEAFKKEIPANLHDDINIQPDESLVAASSIMLGRYHREPDDETSFLTFGKLWRVSNRQPSQNWLSAFAPAQSVATAENSPGSVVAFYQVSTENFATNPRLNWQELRLDKPLNLPELAKVPTVPTLNLPSPISFNFDLSLPKNESGETRVRLIRSTAEQSKEKGWGLLIETASIGAIGTTASPSENLSQAAKLWREWKQAFNEGKWQSVQEKEKQLEKIFSKF